MFLWGNDELHILQRTKGKNTLANKSGNRHQQKIYLVLQIGWVGKQTGEWWLAAISQPLQTKVEDERVVGEQLESKESGARQRESIETMLIGRMYRGTRGRLVEGRGRQAATSTWHLLVTTQGTLARGTSQRQAGGTLRQHSFSTPSHTPWCLYFQQQLK